MLMVEFSSVYDFIIMMINSVRISRFYRNYVYIIFCLCYMLNKLHAWLVLINYLNYPYHLKMDKLIDKTNTIHIVRQGI